MTLLERTEKLIDERGVKKIFIAGKIGVTPNDMSNFLKKRYDFKPAIKRKLEELIDSYYTKLPIEF